MHRDATLAIRKLGRADYAPTLSRMRRLVDLRADDAIPDTLLLVEHEGVYTRGRRADPADLIDPGVPILDVERGGRITWHGPGQLVAYPIVKLTGRARDLHAWLRLCENVVIDALAVLGLEAARDPLGTGVFSSGRKIASVGIAVRRWVTFHGLALNVCPDLRVFERVRPCGFDAQIMTSIERELGQHYEVAVIADAVVDAFRRRWTIAIHAERETQS